MDPAASLARRSREHVDERRHVVVGGLLALVDRLHRERRFADRLQVLWGGSVAVAKQARQLLAGRDLHAAPGLHARLVRP